MLDGLLKNKVTSIGGRALVIAVGFLVMLFWVNTISWLLGRLDPNWSAAFISQVFFRPAPSLPYIIFMACIIAPLWEELAYRVIPVQLGLKAERLMSGSFWYIIAMSCLMFGWGHGRGSVSLLIQGAMGLVFTVVYIKNNYHYWSSVILHFTWNLFCITLYR